MIWNRLSSVAAGSSAGLRRYLGNTAWLVGAKLLQMGVTFWITAWVGRYLEPKQFGVWSYAQSYGQLLLHIASLGMEAVAVRQLVESPASHNRILGTALALRTLSALLTLALLYLIQFVVPHDRDTELLIWLVTGSGVIISLEVFEYRFLSQASSRDVAIARFIGVVLFAGLQLALVLLEAPLIAFGWAFVCKHLFVGIALMTAYIRIHGRPRWQADRPGVRQLFLETWPLALSGLVVLLYMKTDQIMLRWLLDEQAVGYYSAALRFTEIWYFLAPMVTSALFPAIVAARQKSQALYRERLQQFYSLVVWVALAIAVPISLLGPWLLQLPFLYGPSYAPAGNVLLIHIWTLVFVMLDAAGGRQLVAENLQRLTLPRAVFGAVMNIGLNFVFIPRWGIEGAAWATLISQICASYLGFVFDARTRGIFRMQSTALLVWPGYALRRKPGSRPD
ncbi:MAG: flippase [Bacteroidia bacterium]|nr:flippase [Bacteroidia bacterium]